MAPAEDAAEVTWIPLNWGVVMDGDPAPGTDADATKSWFREPRLSSNCARQSTPARTINSPIAPKKFMALRHMVGALEVSGRANGDFNCRKQ
jgi:hypothetical protein